MSEERRRNIIFLTPPRSPQAALHFSPQSGRHTPYMRLVRTGYVALSLPQKNICEDVRPENAQSE